MTIVGAVAVWLGWPQAAVPSASQKQLVLERFFFDSSCFVSADRAAAAMPTAMCCTCGEAKERAVFAATDVRRLCRHMRRELLDEHREKLTPLVVAILEDEATAAYREIYVADIDGQAIAIGLPAGTGCAHVFARRAKLFDPDRHTGPYTRYLLNMRSACWEGVTAPFDADLLIDALASRRP